MNMMKMMKQAQELQAKAAKLQADLASRHYEAESAGGQVKAVATGEGQLVSLKIDPALFKEADAELLEDLIVTAVREAIDKGKADAAKELGKLMPAGLGGLPGF
ncbi:MAG: YbaB/EbfC family nucleoid-associated protein [Methylacidiphilales bacterium]|nr:YbaB/EbfC family nucleoid-associated protein [Candidatus Methylacidiphilales bacterium]